jgi:hypothetical protein
MSEEEDADMGIAMEHPENEIAIKGPKARKRRI